MAAEQLYVRSASPCSPRKERSRAMRCDGGGGVWRLIVFSHPMRVLIVGFFYVHTFISTVVSLLVPHPSSFAFSPLIHKPRQKHSFCLSQNPTTTHIQKYLPANPPK